MTCAPGDRVLVIGVGLGTVRKAGRRIVVRLDTGQDYLARPENVERTPSVPA